MRTIFGFAATALAFTGCVDKGPGPTHKEIDPAYIKKNLLATPPENMTNVVDADLGGKVVYLGNDATADTIVPGEPFKVVHYWKVVDPPGADWRVFAHVEGNPKRGDWMNIDYTDMRVGYGPDKWQAGDVIRDEQEFRLKKDWSAKQAKVVIGLFRKGGQTEADRMPVVSGPGDVKSRVLAATFKVDAHAKPPAARPYVVRKARAPIVVDGRADEDDWKRAPESPAFTGAEGSPEVAGDTRARLLWDDDNLYLWVQARDTDVFSQYKNHDDSLWKEDVVEIFIDADKNRRGYVELQVNPNNAQFDAWFATTRAGGTDMTWTAGMKSAVTVHGTADDRDDRDTGWDVEVAIPLAAVKGTDPAMRVNLPPTPGDTWRLNVVRIDKPQGDSRLGVHSWNPITYRDFHALDRMLEVVFGDDTGNAQAPPPGEQGSPGAQPEKTPEPGAPGTQPAGEPPGTTAPTGNPGQPAPGAGSAWPKKSPATGEPKAGAKKSANPDEPPRTTPGAAPAPVRAPTATTTTPTADPKKSSPAN